MSLTKEQDLDPDLDPLVKSTDPRIRIRTKMSRIRNITCNLNWGPPLQKGTQYDPNCRCSAWPPVIDIHRECTLWTPEADILYDQGGRAQHDFSLAWLEAAWYCSESAQARLETGRFKKGFVKCILLYYPSTEFESTFNVYLLKRCGSCRVVLYRTFHLGVSFFEGGTVGRGGILYNITPLGSVADPWHFGVDPDPDPRIHASN